jgi:hypothetical protein
MPPPQVGNVVGVSGTTSPVPGGTTAAEPEIAEEPKATIIEQDTAIKVPLNATEELDLIKLIEEEMAKIVQEYEEAEFHDRNIDKPTKEYEGFKEYSNFPVKDASNKKLLLTTYTIDIITAKGKRQTMTADPLVLLEMLEDIKTADLRNREDLLDHRLRNDVKLEELISVVYRMACLQGAAVVKIPYAHEVEYFTSKVTYQPSKADIAKYLERYAEDMVDPESKEYKDWEKLEAGETVTKEDEEPQITKHGAYPYRIPLEKFWARLSIKDFARHRVIAEQMDFTWADIDRRAEMGYYDEKKVEDLKKKGGEDYFKNDYKIYEAIVLTDLKKKGKFRRYVVTFDSEHKIILRVIHYPYRHNKIFYIVYNAIPKDDSWLGYSLFERTEDVAAMANSFVNSAINEFTLAHTPTVLTNDMKFDGSQYTLVQNRINVLKFKQGSTATPMKMEYSSMDRVAFLNWISTMLELITGVSGSLFSGRETPTDPRAPAAKTAMKLRESNMRVEDIVINLQKADEALAEQVEKIYLQYPEKEGQETFEYYRNNKKLEVKKEIIEKNVRYVMQGSRLSFDKNSDLQIVMMAIQYMAAYYPDILKDPAVRHTLLKGFLDNAGGSVEKNKAIFLKTLEQQVRIKETRKAIQGKAGAEGEPAEGAEAEPAAGGAPPPGTPAPAS